MPILIRISWLKFRLRRKIINLTAKLISPLLVWILVLIGKIKPIRVGVLMPDRIGNFSITTDLILRRRYLGMLDKNYQYIFVYDPDKIANHYLLRLFQQNITTISSAILAAVIRGSEKFLTKHNLFYAVHCNATEFHEFNMAPPTIKLNDEESSEGRALLQKMGINHPSQPYVCVFARDSCYLKTIYPGVDWNYHNYRNLDIDVFIDSVKYLIDQGYYVIRIGSVVEKPISYKHPMLIDYPYTNFRSEFMDVFLMANCKFVLGTESGGTDLAIVFDIPQLVVNYSIVGKAPWGKNCLYIPIKLRDKKSGGYIPYYECLRRGYDKLSNGLMLEAQGVEYVTNTPEEILKVTQEMVARIEGEFNCSSIELALLDNYYSEFWVNAYAKDVKTPIGIDYLKSYQNLFFESETRTSFMDEKKQEAI